MLSPIRLVCLQSGWRQVVLLLALALLFVPANQAFAQGNGAAFVSPPVSPHSFNGDLSKLPKAPLTNTPAPPLRINPGRPVAPPRPPGPPDPLWQPGRANTASTLAPGVTPTQFTTPSPNFDTGQPGDGPPDANGAVGPSHYIAIVNFTFQVFDKQGNSLSGPTNPATFWSGAPAMTSASHSVAIRTSTTTISPTAG